MKSSEHKASPSASKAQANKSTFFTKKKGEAFARENDSLIQPKLYVHPSADSFEREADAMAEHVMQSQHSNEVNKHSTVSDNIGRVQTKRPFDSPTILETNSAHDDPALQRKEAEGHNNGSEAPGGVESKLNSSKGHGSALPEETQSKMESGFGKNFSHVTVHNDHHAAEMNEELGARAFTYGNDIYFNKGEYKPNTSNGDRLIAHELTHTVQQGGGVQKKSIQKEPKQKDIIKASPDELSEVTKPAAGYLEKNKGDKVPTIHIKQAKAKKYLSKGDVSWLPDQVSLPKGKRHTKQAGLWKGDIREEVKKQMVKLAGNPTDSQKLFQLSLKGKKKGKGARKGEPEGGMVGTVDQLAEEVLVPSWNVGGGTALFDIEHMVDWQICGPLADQIKNLILLDRRYNRQLGNQVRDNLHTAVKAIFEPYRKKFKISDDIGSVLDALPAILYKAGLTYTNEDLSPDQWYSNVELKTTADSGNPFKEKLITVDDPDIPDGHFLLITSDKRPGYILPFDLPKMKIGAFNIVSVKHKNNKLESIKVEPILEDARNTLSNSKKQTPIDLPFDDKGKNTYKIKNGDLNRAFAANLKSFIGGVNGMSPIEFAEPEIDGLNVKITGKVIPTISIFKDVDITFGYEDGMFFIRAEVPLTKLASSIPKPFKVDACSIVIEANSIDGLLIAGFAAFSIGSFGEGEIFAKKGKNVEFGGRFNFNNKWFDPAEINFDYKNGKWGIGGKIGIGEGKIKGIRQATLAVKYANDTFTADGDATLDVPGIKSVKLSASYAEGQGFRFIATADLKKMPGIKSGSVTVSILSKNDGDIKLGAAGTAEPDFPKVPGLTGTSLTVSYDDGVFEMRTKVGYKKGRFDGTVEVGVTNKNVDEKGQPTGEAQKGDNVVVFGYGSLTVDLFKGSKGTISVRLTPDKKLLAAGSFTIQNLKPFGPGVDIFKKIVEFPSIKIPLVGVPGVSIFFEISGGAYFKFVWDPLVLKELTIAFTETDINEIETAQVTIHGSIGSKATAEAYMEVKASLGAQVLIAEIKGSLAGQAGIGVEAEAGGEVDATWNNDKGLQLKQITAYVAVNPKAIFRLKGSVSVDLDLWITTVNLYYKEWTLAEGAADLSGLALKVNFPLKFDDNGDLIRPGFDQLSIEKPDFSGEQGKAALDGGINADAKKERKLAKDKLRQDIARDIQDSTNDEDFSPSEYAKKLQKKYKDDEEMKTFIMDSVEEEVKTKEYQQFEVFKEEMRKSPLTLSRKMSKAMLFKLWRGRISPGDYYAFIEELQANEQQKQNAATAAPATV